MHAEHLIHASDRLTVLLSISCNSIMKHVYIPSGMLDTILTHIVKTKTGDLTDKNTSDNQFGFKKKHGTDMCIHAFRKTIEYYKQNSSPVFICYLDATKSFVRVKYWLLFKALGP